jgi:hypothetical protein
VYSRINRAGNCPIAGITSVTDPAATLEDGAPPSWILLGNTDGTGRVRGFVPTNPVPLEQGSDILNVLRPLAQIEISLEGGVPLGYTLWLAGYPPSIRILGDAQHGHKVFIDGKEATIEGDGVCRVSGWDDPGSHEIWCSNVSRSYTLIRLERTWDAWPAYVFRPRARDNVAICGPLVRPLTIGETLEEVANDLDSCDFIQSNPILLGATPGQVFVTSPAWDIPDAHSCASPTFDPVWALPAQPLRCDKSVHRILLIRNIREQRGSVPSGRRGLQLVSQWCRLILDASRKGLAVQPVAASDLWLSYKQLARDLWRRTR